MKNVPSQKSMWKLITQQQLLHKILCKLWQTKEFPKRLKKKQEKLIPKVNWNTAVNKPGSNTDENAVKYPSKMEEILPKDLSAKLVTKLDRRLFS